MVISDSLVKNLNKNNANNIKTAIPIEKSPLKKEHSIVAKLTVIAYK